MEAKISENVPDPWYYPIAIVEPINDPLPADKILEMLSEAFCEESCDYVRLKCWAMEVVLTYPEQTDARFRVIEAFLRQHLDSDMTNDIAGYNIARLPRTYFMQSYFTDELDAVIKLIDEGLLISEKNPGLLNFKGIMLFHLDKFKAAEACFANACLQDADWPDAALNQLLCLEKLKEFEKALSLYERQAASFPGKAEFKLRQGDLYRGLFMFDKAKACYDVALAAEEATADEYVSLGVLAYLQKDFNRARLNFDRAVLQNNNHILTNLYFGDFLVYQRRFSDAVVRYNLVSDKYKKYPFLLFRVDNANDEKGTPLAGSTGLPDKLEELKREEVKWYLWAVIAHFREGHYNRCRDFLTLLAEKSPKDANIRFFLAKSHVYSNDKTRALEELSKGVDLLKAKLSWLKHYSQPLLQYKQQVIQKKIEVFTTLAGLLEINFDQALVPALSKRNAILELLYRLYKTKFLLKYSYLLDEEIFPGFLADIDRQIEQFKAQLADRHSVLFTPTAIQTNPASNKYYNTILKVLTALSKLSDQKADGAKDSPSGQGQPGLPNIVSNLSLFVKYFPPTGKLKPTQLHLDLANLQLFGGRTEDRYELLKEVSQEMLAVNDAAIKNPQKNREVTLFANQGFIGRFYEYFSHLASSSVLDQVEQLAKVHAIKLIIIFCQGLYDPKDAEEEAKHAPGICGLAKAEFSLPDSPKKSCCQIF